MDETAVRADNESMENASPPNERNGMTFAHFTPENIDEAASDARRLYNFARFTQGMDTKSATERIAGLFGISFADAGRLVGIGVANHGRSGN